MQQKEAFVQKLIEVSEKNYTLERANYSATCTAFEGVPRSHPHEKNLLMLMGSPYSDDRDFYEFSFDHIVHVEELGTATDENGDTLFLMRIWVKKGSPALHYTPFIVG